MASQAVTFRGNLSNVLVDIIEIYCVENVLRYFIPLLPNCVRLSLIEQERLKG